MFAARSVTTDPADAWLAATLKARDVDRDARPIDRRGHDRRVLRDAERRCRGGPAVDETGRLGNAHARDGAQ